VLGAAYNETAYMFIDYDAQTPMTRAANIGFRCAKYPMPPSGEVLAPLEALSRNYAKERPVDDSKLDSYLKLFRYERSDLRSAVEASDDISPYWKREKISFDAAYFGERMIAILFLPRNAKPPYQTVLYVPGAAAFDLKGSSESIKGSALDFIMRSGRALIYPIYKGSYERGGGVARPVNSRTWQEAFIACSKDLGRSIDYLETRRDIDMTRLAYYGVSLGAWSAPVLITVDGRFKTAVLQAGGLPLWAMPSEVDSLNYASHVGIPVLMINGRQDFFFPLQTSQVPLFRLLGAAGADNRHVLIESGHAVPKNPRINEIVSWLDKYLGPAR